MEEHLSLEDITHRIHRVVSEAIHSDQDELGLDTPIYSIDNEEDYALVGGFLLVEALFAVQEEFDLKIPDNHMENLTTVRKYATYVHRRLTSTTTKQKQPGSILGDEGQSDTQFFTSSSRKRTASKKVQKQVSLSPDAWIFDQGHWEPAEESKTETSAELDDVQRLGYMLAPVLTMGTHHQGVSAEVHRRAQKDASSPSLYYMKLWIGTEHHSIFVQNLPSLISLLSRISIIIQNNQ